MVMIYLIQKKLRESKTLTRKGELLSNFKQASLGFHATIRNLVICTSNEGMVQGNDLCTHERIHFSFVLL